MRSGLALSGPLSRDWLAPIARSPPEGSFICDSPLRLNPNNSPVLVEAEVLARLDVEHGRAAKDTESLGLGDVS